MLVALTLVPLLASSPDVAEDGSKGVYALTYDQFMAQARQDLRTLRLYANGLRRLQRQLEQDPSLFHHKESEPYTPEQKAKLLSIWGAFFSYFISAEAIRQRYWDFVRIPPTDTARHLWGYVLTHTALTTELAHGLTFADRTAGNRQLEVLLDEPNPEFGVPPSAFAQFKVKSIHVATATQLFTGDEYGQRMLPLMRKHKLLDEADVVRSKRRASTRRPPAESSSSAASPSSPGRPATFSKTAWRARSSPCRRAWPRDWATRGCGASASRSSRASRSSSCCPSSSRGTSWWRGRTGPTSACRASGRTPSCTSARPRTSLPASTPTRE